MPTIVAGDLNSTPPSFPKSTTDADGNNAIDAIDRSGYFQRLPVNANITHAELTFHSAKPDRLIDWIMIPQGWQFLDYRVVASQLSDHRPVVAEIELNSPIIRRTP